MIAAPIRLLLLEDNEGDARLVRAALAEDASGGYAVIWVERLADALARLRTERFDAVLCDLGLTDSTGLATAQAIAALSPELPVVVLTGLDDKDLGRAAIQHGAQDYLVKGESGGALIARALHYAIERKRLEIGLRTANEALEHRVAERTAGLEAATKKLGTSETRFRELTELTSDWYWEQDENLRFTWFSDGAMQHIGIDIGEYIGYTRRELPIDQVAEAQWAEHGRQTEAHLAFRDFQYRWTNRNGGQYHLSISGRPVFDEHRRFRGYRGVGSDITRRKQAELALARQKDLYNALSQTNQAIVRGVGREELFPALCRIAVEHGHFRFAWIGLIDRNDKRVKPVAQYGEDAGYVKQLDISIDETVPAGSGRTGRALRTGRCAVNNDLGDERASAPSRNRDAARRAGVRAYGTFPIRQRGVVVGVINFYAAEAGFFTEDLIATLEEMAQDLSFALDNFEREAERARAQQALSESEARFRSLTEMSSDFYWESDVEHRLTKLSSGGKARGVPALQQGVRIGKRRWEMPYLAPDEAGWQAHRAVLDARQPFRDFEFSRLDTGGTERHVSVSGDPVFEASGAFRGYRGVGSDITERKLHEDELRRLNEELERRVEQRTHALQMVNRELEAFSYSVSHDLRAPLRAINGFGQMIEDECAARLDARGRELLGRVRAGAERMGHLIDDLLKLSQISRHAMHIRRVDLSALAREVADELQAGDPVRRVQWVIAPGVTAQGDAGLLKVALQNLIGNAWKYSSGGDTARVEFGVAGGQGHPEYFVRDDGAGFDMAYTDKLFVAFQRLHLPSEFPGTGIGLATVARVIHCHGGEVRAEGRLGEGASFYFTLRAALG